MANSIANLAVILSANTGQYAAGMRRAGGITQQFSLSVKGIGSAVGRVLPQLAAVASVAGIVGGAIRGITTQLSRLDEMAKTAAKIGTTTEELSRLQFAGEKTGVAVNTMNMALQRMTRRISEAAAGSGEAKDALIELGLDAQKLNDMGPADAFKAIANAMSGVKNQSDRVRLAMRLFDSEGVALVNTLAGGSEALDEFARQSDLFGNTVDSKAAKAAEAFNDAMTDLKSSIGGVFAQLVRDLAPALTKVVEGMSKFVAITRMIIGAIRDFVKENETLIRVLAGIWSLGASELFPMAVRESMKRIEDQLPKVQAKAKELGDAILNDLAKPAMAGTLAISTLVASTHPLAKQFGAMAEQAQSVRKEFTEVSDAMEDMANRAARIFEKTRTPAERLAAELREIQELATAGFLDPETARRAVAQLNQDSNRNAARDNAERLGGRVDFAAMGAAEASGRRNDAMLRLQKQQAESDKRREETQRRTLDAIRKLRGDDKLKVVQI